MKLSRAMLTVALIPYVVACKASPTEGSGQLHTATAATSTAVTGQPGAITPQRGTAVEASAACPPPSGLLAAFRTTLGKAVSDRAVYCVSSRNLDWNESETSNFFPLTAAYDGEELVYRAKGNHLELRFEGMLTIGPRMGVSVQGEISAPGMGIRRFQIDYLGSTGMLALAHGFSHQEDLFGVPPGTPVRVRVAYWAITADDGACSAMARGVSLSAISTTVKDYFLPTH